MLTRLELYEQGYNDKEIAEITGAHQTTISKWRRKNNLKNNKKGNEYYELWQQGMTDSQISKRTKKHAGTIRNWRKRNGLKPNKEKPKFDFTYRRKSKNEMTERMKLFFDLLNKYGGEIEDKEKLVEETFRQVRNGGE